MGYSPWGCKELDTTDGLALSLQPCCLTFKIAFPTSGAPVFPGKISWLGGSAPCDGTGSRGRQDI